jgi:hypothetical protein
MIAAGIAVGAESLRYESPRVCQELGGRSDRIVRPQNSNRRRDTSGSELAQLKRRDPGVHSGLATASGEMHMDIDQTGDDSAALEITLFDS